MDHSVFVTDVTTGESTRLTPRADDATAPEPYACVFSPDGARIAYSRPVPASGTSYSQVFVVTVPAAGSPGRSGRDIQEAPQ
jgi:Tol biopolymer transport system component